jgi:glucose/arabinose dehydrogenase
MQRILSLVIFLFIALLNSGCYRMRVSNGGGDVRGMSRDVNAHDVALSPGYKIDLVAKGFTFPTDIAFDENGSMYVLEAGYAYGEVWKPPMLIEVKNDSRNVIATGEKNGPWTGVTYHNGNFYIAEGGEANGGKILRVSKKGEIKTLVENLPSIGDHHTNVPVIKDGYIYFGQGTATNSAVVGPDNAEFGWLKRHPDFHDTPCGDITLAGTNYQSENPLSGNANEKTTTGAYMPFGKQSSPGEVVKGKVPCNGSIMRIPIDGGQTELVAWGLRNPFGLALSPDGKLFTTENAYDERGSRPVWGAGDVLWEVKNNTWYGWPDFSAGKRIVNDEEFTSPKDKRVKPVLAKYPNDPPQPAAILSVHTSSNGFDFSRNKSFGFEGEAFVAQFGDMAPKVGKVLYPVGFKVVRVNVVTGVVQDFAVNKGKRNGPASWLKKGGLERPVSVKFDPHGNALYVVDFGIVKMTEKGPQPQEKTGVIWKIEKE